MTAFLRKLMPGQEVSEALINRIIDATNRARITSPDLLIEQTSAGTNLALPRQPAVEPPPVPYNVRPFELLEDLIPNRYIGSYDPDSPADHVLTPTLSVQGFWLDDTTEEPVDLWPADETDRFDATHPLALGVGRQGSSYVTGTRGWARWIPEAHQDFGTGETVLVGQWQIVQLDASLIVDARAGGPWQIIESA